MIIYLVEENSELHRPSTVSCGTVPYRYGTVRSVLLICTNSERKIDLKL